MNFSEFHIILILFSSKVKTEFEIAIQMRVAHQNLESEPSILVNQVALSL